MKELFNKKIYQKLCNDKTGDCMKCCIATLFEKDYDEVPNFIEQNDWGKSFQETINSYGYKSYETLFNESFQRYILNIRKSCFEDIDMSRHFLINKINLLKFNGVNIKGEKIMLGTVVSPFLFDHDKTIDYMYEHQHMVLIDEKCNIVFDPNPHNKGILRYPLAPLIGYNGITEVWELKEI